MMTHERKAGFTNWSLSIKSLSLRARLRRLAGDAAAVGAFAVVMALLWWFQ